MKIIIRSIVASLAIVTLSHPLISSAGAQEQKPTVSHYVGPREDAPIPRPGLRPKKGRVAVVVTDPQNDFLSPKGVAWGVVGQSVQENHTVEHIEDGRTVVTSPHKVFGPESNDLILQLRKADIGQVILAGMSANLCTESHMRELLEQGFEVVVVTDATAAAKLPGFDGYEAAFVNIRMMASDVWSTAQAVKTLAALK